MGYYTEKFGPRESREGQRPMGQASEESTQPFQLQVSEGMEAEPVWERKDLPASEDAEKFEELCRRVQAKTSNDPVYKVQVNLSLDDDMDQNWCFLFHNPKAASYDRYVKTASVSSTKAMRTFVLDNINNEQKKDLEEKLTKYPAMGISLGEKLLYMLGLSKTTTVTRL